MTPDIVIGPPGTGKTTRLLGMVEESLARGVPPEQIGYVSFTKRAAGEAIERAMAKFGLPRERLRFFRTLHSLCFNALGLSNGDVFEGKKVVEFGQWLGVELSEMRFSDDGTMAGFTPGDRAMFMENLARVRMVPLRQQFDYFDDGLNWTFVEHLARGLRQYKKDQGLLDYTDMLEHFLRSDWTPDLEELYVDESQDNTMLQWLVVEKLALNCRNVTVAGDDDQAIYHWAGAAVEHFVGMQGHVEVLGQSWRCRPKIQALSHEVIERVGQRRPKEWLPDRRQDDGVVERVGAFGHADLSGQDILVLARNAFVLRDIMPMIRADGVIYEWRGQTSVSRSVLDAVRLWEKLRADPAAMIRADEARLMYEWLSSGSGVRRGFKTLPGIPDDQTVNMGWLLENGGLMRTDIWHDALERVPQEERIYLMRARQKGERTTSRPRVRLSTIHGAKGGEADHVILLRDLANRTFHEMHQWPDHEARVWYVAITRAKERLTVVAPRTRMSYDF